MKISNGLEEYIIDFDFSFFIVFWFYISLLN